ncbi:hypothetical protein E1A91_D04G151900v1, partial [Gossypium mustelinum]
ATGRIVCVNFHLANKPVDIEVPQAVLLDTVFEAVVRIPYGCCSYLPEGFELALPDHILPEMKEKKSNLSFQNYRPTKKNTLVIDPVPGKKYSEITFPILSTDPVSIKDVHFLKYPIYVGKNRGRGQIYPDGKKSNNNATATGIGYEITITDALDGHQVVDIIPPGPKLLISKGESIKLDQPLTINPNVGGFGLLFFLASINFAQIFLVLKKKQFEKVQVSQMNF